jgi:uncharacterized membrane protein YfcA
MYKKVHFACNTIICGRYAKVRLYKQFCRILFYARGVHKKNAGKNNNGEWQLGTVKRQLIFVQFLGHYRKGYGMLKKTLKISLIGLVAGAANGLFGSGGGTLLVPGLKRFMDVEPHKAHATALAVMLPLSVVSAAIYLKGGDTDLKAAFWISVGGLAGGLVGAALLKKIPNKWLRRIFGAFMAAAAVRMLL